MDLWRNLKVEKSVSEPGINKRKLSTADLAVIALMASVIAVCSWITIPSAVPFTMQSFAVFLAVGLLGGKRGSLAVLIYILLGSIGLPVFSGFRGGLAHLAGPTGGYIIGFLFAALIMWAVEHIAGKGIKPLSLSMVLGLLVCYTFGTIWFIIVYSKSAGPISVGAALGMCVIPFIIPDIIKIVLAVILTLKLRPRLPNLT